MKQTKRGEALVGGGVFLRRGASMASVAWGARPCWWWEWQPRGGGRKKVMTCFVLCRRRTRQRKEIAYSPLLLFAGRGSHLLRGNSEKKLLSCSIAFCWTLRCFSLLAAFQTASFAKVVSRSSFNLCSSAAASLTILCLVFCSWTEELDLARDFFPDRRDELDRADDDDFSPSFWRTWDSPD